MVIHQIPRVYKNFLNAVVRQIEQFSFFFPVSECKAYRFFLITIMRKNKSIVDGFILVPQFYPVAINYLLWNRLRKRLVGILVRVRILVVF